MRSKARLTRWATTSVSVSEVNSTPSASSPALSAWKFSMIPLCTRASLPSWPPRCGWAFSLVGPPCVAQRVWPIAVAVCGSGASESASRRFSSLPARLRVSTVVPATAATPAES